MKELKLKFYHPAEDNLEGWEKYSFPIGNGYAGASIFGGVEKERIQITTNAFANSFSNGGVSNFAEIHIFSDASNYIDYRRELDILNGVATSEFIKSKSHTKRTSFYDYPDNVLIYRIQSEEKDGYKIKLVIPYLNSRKTEEGGRTGNVYTEKDTIVMRGELPSRKLLFEGRLKVRTDGTCTYSSDTIEINGATDTTVYFTFDTSYVLSEETFIQEIALGSDPHEKCLSLMNEAFEKGYDKLLFNHINGFSALMKRVEFDLGGKEDERSTEDLLLSNRNGNFEPYLEELYYMYGRYLLCSSSRKGTLPSSLQGVWTAHDKSPWGSGFWHNINIQMNYWPAFSTNLMETFYAYADFNKAYLKKAQMNAKEWIKYTNPENYLDDCGWTIATGAFAYEVEGFSKYTHSGPGTGALTSKMFYDFYDYTRDENILKDYAYPAVHGMAKFLVKTVRKYDDRYLCSFSASPEQILSGWWVDDHKYQQYIQTVGCSFDQEMIFENAKDDLKLSKILSIEDKTVQLEKTQIDHYDNIRVGYSGQIKEYDEENFYGEYGEAKHRHLSQLVGLVPGSQIDRKAPHLLDAARITLEKRGDKSTGWALAHRICSWAKIGDGNHAYQLLQELLKNRTHPNLWDVHPPFQIDGNFGAVAGMTEMMLESQNDVIYLAPSIPDEWKNFEIKGLKARGNFTVSFSYKNGCVQNARIESCKGKRLNLFIEDSKSIFVSHKNENVSYSIKDGIISFETKIGGVYEITGFENAEKSPIVKSFSSKKTPDSIVLSWKKIDDYSYAIYRSRNNDKDYTLIKETKDCLFKDMEYSDNLKCVLTYKVVAFKKNHSSLDDGALSVVNPASKLEEERYNLKFKMNNINLE